MENGLAASMQNWKTGTNVLMQDLTPALYLKIFIDIFLKIGKLKR